MSKQKQINIEELIKELNAEHSYLTDAATWRLGAR